tara:strand:- start:42 stop:689 length:648 start_codon:yes stop_codon:yes gene_type:complete
MPRKTITDYTFYKLHCNTCDDIYIGCTSNFNNRKCEHKGSVNNPNRKNYNTKKAQFIRDNGGWDNWKMSPLEIKKDLRKREAECYETELLEKYKPSLNSMLNSFVTDEQKKERIKEYNKTRPKRDPEKTKEYYQDNKEKIKEWKAKYDEENKELIHQKKKEYYEKNKEQINEKSKKYRENNKELIRQKSKKYYEENKERINAKRMENYYKSKEKN